MTKRKDNGHGEKILELMREFDLFAVDTLFKPARKAWGKDKKIERVLFIIKARLDNHKIFAGT